MTPMLGILASQISGHLASPSSYESIATTTLGSSTGSITFSSIPSTYTHLQLRILWFQATGDQSMFITFNGVSTGTSYAYHQLEGNGSAASTGAASSAAKWESFYDGNNSGSTTYEKVGILDILDYGNINKYKTSRLLWGAEYNGAGKISFGSCLFQSTSAISSISFQPFSTNFAANTRIALYGIKGA
jgi:hypothetical protein